MLNRRGIQAGTDLGEQPRPVVAFDAVDTHLDQFMCLQAAVDLGEDGIAEAVLADAGDGVQAVGAGAQRPAQG